MVFLNLEQVFIKYKFKTRNTKYGMKIVFRLLNLFY